MRESDLPGQRLLAGEEAPTLLTRSVVRETGRVYWLLTKATRLDDAGTLAVNIIEDVTEAKTAERRQRFLADAGELLVASRDYGQTLQHVAALVVPTLADWCALDLVDETGDLQRVALVHHDPDKRRLADDLHERYPPRLGTDQGLAAVLLDGRSMLVPEITDEMLAGSARDEEHAAAAARARDALGDAGRAAGGRRDDRRPHAGQLRQPPHVRRDRPRVRRGGRAARRLRGRRGPRAALSYAAAATSAGS